MIELKFEESSIEESSSSDSPVKLFDENSFRNHPRLNELQATELRYLKDVSYLLRSMYESGADPNYIFQGSAHGLTPLAIACQEDNPEVVRFLLEKGANPNFDFAIFYIRSVEVAKVFVEFGADLKAKGWYGNTLLHSVCVWNNVALAQFYIDQGLSVGEQNDFGQTPTHYAFTRLISVPNDIPLQPLTNLPPKQEPSKHLAKMGARHQMAHALLSASTSNETKRAKLPKMVSGTPRELELSINSIICKTWWTLRRYR